MTAGLLYILIFLSLENQERANIELVEMKGIFLKLNWDNFFKVHFVNISIV